ncbi:hypothetical protein [Methylocystis sp.]|uniref:hypothetical protein n=1 Tax=Methylocystis sp. TaxID=1911079 RepID=UPI0025D2CAC6|nr:hypothetical protein [Methylocystis sp.]
MFRSAIFSFLILIVLPTFALAQDVAARCAKVGDDDKTKPIPAALVPQARQLFGFSRETPNAVIRKGTSYRCMGGKTWLCNVGANLVCGKADASQSLPGAAAFCKDNPGSDMIPMAATGHDTIYEWKCVGPNAQIARKIVNVDSRGFIAENWKPLD